MELATLHATHGTGRAYSPERSWHRRALRSSNGCTATCLATAAWLNIARLDDTRGECQLARAMMRLDNAGAGKLDGLRWVETLCALIAIGADSHPVRPDQAPVARSNHVNCD